MLSRTQRVAIHTVETAYRQARDGQSPWMQEVLSAVRPLLDAGRGVLAFEYEQASSGCGRLSRPILCGASPAIGDAVLKSFERTGGNEWRRFYRDAPLVAPISQIIGGSLQQFAPSAALARDLGVLDFIRVNARVGPGRGVLFCAPTGSMVGGNLRRLRQLADLADHLAAAVRLRRRAHEDVDIGVARALGEDGAWSAVASGRWSIVGEGMRDGRRCLLALPSVGGSLDPRRLTTVQRLVCEGVARGEANKVIAWRLGLAEGTVAAHVHAAALKLGARTRVELANLVRLLREGELREAEGEPGIDIAAAARSSAALSLLSDAERAVASLAVRGASNQAIARARDVSTRTVANQLASVFRKLSVGSRGELAARWPAD